MPTRPPRLLIASSSEGLAFAEALQDLLAPAVASTIWNQGLFVPGEYALESLESRAREFDGAVVVATADDKVISRGQEAAAPRDNLLIEFGMFVTVFGRRRALLMVESQSSTKLPSDVSGLTLLPFARTTPLKDGVAPAATRLKELAIGWRDRPYDPEMVLPLERVLRLSLSEVQERSGVGGEFGIHVFVVDARESPPVLVRVARERSSPKQARTWGAFEKGVGIVGTCWQTGNSVFADLTDAFFQSATETAWSALPEPDRLGMDFEMLRISRERYKAVGAIPLTTIRGGGEFLGCISYNLGARAAADVSQLRTDAVDRVLDTCAEMVGIVLAIRSTLLT